MTQNRKVVETEWYELPLEDYLKYEYIAAQLELTVDYLLDEFSDGKQLIVPGWVKL